jgi:hypothetical protein
VNQEQEAAGPGIVVLSSSLQVLHMNRRAMALLNQVAHTAQSRGAARAVAAPLYPHGQDIIETLQGRLGSNNWEQFQHNRVIGDSPHLIFLNGFGLPDRRGLPHSRIVMLLSLHIPNSRCRESAEGNARKSSPSAATWMQTCHLQSACNMRHAIAPSPPLSRACDPRKLFGWNGAFRSSANSRTFLYLPSYGSPHHRMAVPCPAGE